MNTTYGSGFTVREAVFNLERNCFLLGISAVLIDMHCHSVFSQDNNLEPADLIDRAVQLGLDGVCFTEHYSVDASRPVERIERPDGFLIFRGVEISTDVGHVLVYGLSDDSWNVWGRNLHLNLAEIMEIVHALGGICIPAHPFRGWESFGERIYTIKGLDGIETHNGVDAPLQQRSAMEAALKLGLPSIGGSDCHHLNQVGRTFTEFKDPISSMADIIVQIKAGTCRGKNHE